MKPPFFLPDGYVENTEPAYFDDADDGKVWQPDVYALAAAFARAAGVTTLVDVGCGRAEKALATGLKVAGIDHGPNVARAIDAGALVRDRDLEKGLQYDGVLSNAVVVCADVIEHLRDPRPLLRDLAASPVLLLSTPDRTLVRHADDQLGPPANACHVREWDEEGLWRLLLAHGIDAHIVHTMNNDDDREYSTLLAVAVRERVTCG